MLDAQERPPAAERKPQIEVVPVTAAHSDALAEFVRAVWDPEATGTTVRAARARAAESNPVSPGTEFPTFILLSDGKVLGHIGTLPTRFWDGARERAAYWLNGFMVLPEYRGGPIGYLVLKEAVRQLGLAAALTVATPSRRLFEALGFARIGIADDYLTLLRPASVLRSLDASVLAIGGLPAWSARALRVAQRSGLAAGAGAIGGLALGAWKRFASRGSGRFTLAVGAPSVSASELDDLWQRARNGLRAAAVRDGVYLLWRYGGGAGSAYEFAVVRDRDAVLGVAVVRRPKAEGDPRLRGIKVATVSDILFPPDRVDAGAATVAAAEAVARRMGADALLCGATHPALAALLRRFVYVKLPGTIHFLLRDPDGTRALPESITDWWITRGDANADETF